MNALPGSLTAIIFNVQRFCLHDGPGVRTTVFLKGCPLSCAWCHNPESQRLEPELLYDAGKCQLCGRCVDACPQGAIDLNGGTAAPDRGKCTACGACVEVCPSSARKIAGREYTVPQLMAEIERDRPFFEDSGGGVTFSGGEPLVHIDFVEASARACSARGISVVIDTCGAVPYVYFQRVLPYTNVFLYDLKLMDSDAHKKFTGAGNEQILANLQRLSEEGAAIHLRLPLIDGVNADEKAIRDVLDFVDGLAIDRVHLLQYHDIGRGKYPRLGRDYPGQTFRAVPEGRLAQIAGEFACKGYPVIVGG